MADDGLSDQDIGYLTDEDIGVAPQKGGTKLLSDKDIGYLSDEQIGVAPTRPQPEGKFKGAMREALHGIVPTVTGMIGAGAGAVAGSAGGPVGSFAGGVGGMFAGAAAGAAGEHAVLDAMGFNDDIQRAVNAEENPYSTLAGGLLPAAATLNPARAASALQRAGAFGMGAAFEGGQELYQEGKIDPGKVAISGGMFAIAPHMNEIGESLAGAGGRLARKAGLKDYSVPPTQASGTATEMPKPNVTEGDEIGNPQSRPTRSSRKAPKAPAPDDEPQSGTLTMGEMDPTIKDALSKSLNGNTTAAQGPVPDLPKPGPDLKNMKNPGEKLPLDQKTTGFDEQIAKQQEAIKARQAELGGDQPQTGFQTNEPQPSGTPAPEGSWAGWGAPGARPRAADEAIAASKSRGKKPEADVQASEAIATGPDAVNKAESGLLTDEEAGFKQHPADMIREAAKDTDNAATPDQKRAGNYKKGGGSGDRMFGRMIKIETPKGEIRRSHPEDDVQWEVKSPADYGYFRGTAGADSKPGKPEGVDFYNVGNGDNHYVIDQRNPETGKFDEHKVMANAKDPASAIDVYNRGFSDGRGPERLGAITKISDEEAAKWLGTPGRKKDPYSKLWEDLPPKPQEELSAPEQPKQALATPKQALATYTPKKGFEPKIVKLAKQKMIDSGMFDDEAIQRFEAMKPDDKLALANKYVNETDTVGVRPNRVRTKDKERFPTIEGILNDEGKPVTTGTFKEAEEKSADVAKMNEAYGRLFGEDDVKLLPASGDPDAATRQYLKDKLTEYLDETKDVAYKPNFKHEPYLLERAARDLLKNKNPSDADWKEFARTVELLRGGGADLVRQGTRIEDDIKHNTRSGDDAIAGAEAEAATGSHGEREAEIVSSIDASNKAWLAKNYPEGEKTPYIDVPEEESEQLVQPKPIKERKDWRAVELGPKEMDLANPEDREKLHSDAAVLAANIMRQNRESPRKPPVKASEDIKAKKSDARKPKLSAEEMEDLKKSIEKAEARNKRYNPGSVRDEELGRFDTEPPTRKTLVERVKQAAEGVIDTAEDFIEHPGGSLNYQKIGQDYRTKVLPIMRKLGSLLAKEATAIAGYRANMRQVKIDALGRHAISDYMRQLSQRAELMDGKYEMWENLPKKHQVDFQKLLEEHKDVKINVQKFEKDLINKFQVKPADAKWMAEDAPIWRDMLQGIWKLDKMNGIDLGYLQGYMSHIFVEDHAAADWIMARLQQHGARWYTKTRLFDTIQAAEKAGFKLKFENPVDLLNARLNASYKNHMLLGFARSLKEWGYATPTKDASDRQKRAWTKKVGLADGKEWLLAPDAEAVWKNGFEADGLQNHKGRLGSIYRNLMKIKAVSMPIQLGMSLFHGGHIVSIMLNENLSRALKRSMKGEDPIAAYAQAFRDIARDGILALPWDKIKMLENTRLGKGSKNFEGRQIMEDWGKPLDQLQGANKMISQMFGEAGTAPHQSQEDIIGAKRNFVQALANWRKNPTGFGANLKMIAPSIARGIEKSQEWLFKYYVPQLKNVALMRRMKDAVQFDPKLANDEMRRMVVFGELARANDNRFGEMFYKGLFINKTLKDIANLSFVSLGWNLGQGREVGGAASAMTRATIRLFKGDTRSPLEKARQEAADHISFVAHYVGTTALAVAALGWALSGQMPDQIADFVYPRNGEKNDDGTEGRLSTPFNTREPFMLKAHIDERNSVLGGMAQLLWNKMILQPYVSLFTNKDFAGEHIWDTNAGSVKAALQGVDATLGHMFNPISVAGGIRAYQEGGGKKGVALSIAGFGPAPKYANEDKWQRRITTLYREQAVPEVKPYEYGPKTGLGKGAFASTARMALGDRTEGEARAEYRKKFNHAKQTGDREAMTAAAQGMVREGHLKAKTINDQQKGNIYTYRFARLPAATQEAEARTMPNEEFEKYVLHNPNHGIKKDAIARMKIERGL